MPPRKLLHLCRRLLTEEVLGFARVNLGLSRADSKNLGQKANQNFSTGQNRFGERSPFSREKEKLVVVLFNISLLLEALQIRRRAPRRDTQALRHV